MVQFKIFAENEDQNVVEYTIKMNASYSEIEEASKKEHFISWVVDKATSIEGFQISDFTSNDFLETILCDADNKLATYYVASGEDTELLAVYKKED